MTDAEIRYSQDTMSTAGECAGCSVGMRHVITGYCSRTCELEAKLETLRAQLKTAKADGVRGSVESMISKVVIPKAAPIRQEYYKAAINHCRIFLNNYANTLEGKE